jgi:hypothetical protein
MGAGSRHRRRIAPQGAGTPRAAESGLIVQAVLVMVLVATFGLLAIINRVTASRQAAAAGSLAAAARQAAEVGYSEIMTEMNRDSKSYLWITKFNQWDTVSQADLNACSVGSFAAPSVNPIAGIGAYVDIGTALNAATGATLELPISLSYRLVDYRVPDNLAPPPSDPDCSKFGNLFGGTSLITIEGTARRGNGEVTRFTLKRTISVARAPAMFNNPLLFTPLNRSGASAAITAADVRFPAYINIPSLTNYAITCVSTTSSGPYDIQCSASGLTTANFRSPNTPTTTAIRYFPYLPDGSLWPACTQGASSIQCSISSLTLSNGGGQSIFMVVDTAARPVEFFLSGTLSIDAGVPPPSAAPRGSVLSGSPSTSAQDAGNAWTRFRIYSIAAAGCPARVAINRTYPEPVFPATTSPATANLQHAFVWMPCGTVANQSPVAFGNPPAVPGISGLIGWASTITNTVAVPAGNTTISPRALYEGLIGTSASNIFGTANRIRFQYRGYGFYEQSPNLP